MFTKLLLILLDFVIIVTESFIYVYEKLFGVDEHYEVNGIPEYKPQTFKSIFGDDNGYN